MNNENVREYKADSISMTTAVGSLEERRTYIASAPCVTKGFTSDVTIWITAYNHFEKTKRCIESLMKYTADVDFDLILVDNNAGEETYEYFKNLDYPKKTVIHFDENTGSAYPFSVVPIDMISRYFVLLNNDVIVTKNWLTNLLKVMKSDPAIGIVNPSSNNVSNYQEISFDYNTYEEMQAIAEKINVSDKSKWHERLRIITIGTLISKECLYAMGWPLFDVGFSHNFMDDDMSFRARRAGYKLMVAHDTWVCHDHFADRENDEEFDRVIKRDVEKFKKKYQGINTWEDTIGSLREISGLTDKIKRTDKNEVNVLGVNPRCGMTILDIKNLLPYSTNVKSSAYFQDAKYYVDLATVCNDKVICDKEKNIRNHFEAGTYDYIVINEAINVYDDPIGMISDAHKLLADGGQIICSLRNTNNAISLLNAIGYKVNIPKVISQDIQFDDLNVILANMGIRISGVVVETYENMSDDVLGMIKGIVDKYGNKGMSEAEIFARIEAKTFWLVIEKSKSI